MFKYAFPMIASVVIAIIWFVSKSYTDPILAPQAISELTTLDVNGDKQWLLARGCNRRNPVLLFLHGGPGMPAMYTAHAFQRPLERDYVVVHWDQRGAGKSYHGDIDPNTMTMTQLLADAETVVEHLREKFGVEKIVLAGHSHGTFFGTLLAEKRPDLFYAYVGLGQIGDPALEPEVQEVIIREWYVRQGIRAPLIDGANREAMLFKIGGELANAKSMWPLLSTGLMAPEYSLSDALNVAKGPQFAQKHLRYDIPNGYSRPPIKFDIPVYVIMGEKDAVTPVSLARAWFESVLSPSKTWVEVGNAAHFPHFEQPEHFAKLMRRVRREAIPAPSSIESSGIPIPRFGLQCRKQ